MIPDMIHTVAHLAPSGDPFSNGWNAAMKL